MKYSDSTIGGQLTDKSTASVTASPASDAEFCDSPGAFVRFGLRRSLLYDLYGQGLSRACRSGDAVPHAANDFGVLTRSGRISHRKWAASSEHTSHTETSSGRRPRLDAAVIGKTRATAEAWSKKGHFYKPLPTDFGAVDSITGRSPAKAIAAIYEQTLEWLPQIRAFVTR